MRTLTLTLIILLCVSVPQRETQAADSAPASPKPWSLGERDGRQFLLTPDGKAFMMFGISHVDGAFAKGDNKATRADEIEKQLRGWGFNTVPAGIFWDRFPFIVPLDRLVGDQENRYEDVFDPAFKSLSVK